MSVKIDRSLLEYKKAIREVRRLLEQYKTLGFFLLPLGRDCFLVCWRKKEKVVGRLRKGKFLIYSGTLKRLLQKSKKLEDFLF